MEITANTIQTVTAGDNLVFTNTTVPSNSPCIMTREDSSLILLRGITQSGYRARFRASFYGNVALASAAGGVVSLALMVNGETLPSSTMIVTPTVASAYFNVATSIFIDVPAGCALTVSIQNTSENDITVQNANLIIERVA